MLGHKPSKKTHVNNCLLLWWFWAQYYRRCCACSSCEKRRRKKSLLSGNKNDNDKTWCKFYLTVTVNLPIYFVSLFSTLRCHLTLACFRIRCTGGESSDVRKKLHEMPKHCAQLKKNSEKSGTQTKNEEQITFVLTTVHFKSVQLC